MSIPKQYRISIADASPNYLPRTIKAIGANVTLSEDDRGERVNVSIFSAKGMISSSLDRDAIPETTSDQIEAIKANFKAGSLALLKANYGLVGTWIEEE